MQATGLRPVPILDVKPPRRMTPKWLRRLLFAVLVNVLFLSAFFCYAFYVQLERAKMASQVSVLSAEIDHYFGEVERDNKQPDLNTILARVDGRGLFARDSSGQLFDSYGRPLLIQQTGTGGALRVTVTSTGRDGKLGTGDDFSREITFERQPKNNE